MAPGLVSGHPAAAFRSHGPAWRALAPDGAARDWAEIQERMLVPLYEAVYERLEVGADTRLLGLGCGSGLALLMAAARGAAVTGVERDERRLALARERLLPSARFGETPLPRAPVRLLRGEAEAKEPSGPPFTLVTAFERAGAESLGAVVGLAERGCPVVLAGWGPPERCATAGVLRVAERLTERGRRAVLPAGAPDGGRDDLELLAGAAGLRPAGSGRVACPFAYPDLDSAVRGLVSTGLFDQAVASAGRNRVGGDVAEALLPFRRPDGSVRMDNVFRYLIARG